MPLTTESAARKDKTTAASATLEHRHFAFIAATIKAMPFSAGLRQLPRDIAAKHFADACARTNPRFDRKRFLSACGVEE